MNTMAGILHEDRLAQMLWDDHRSLEERQRLARVMLLFAELPPPPDPDGHFPRYLALKEQFLDALQGDSGERAEETFLELYSHVHMVEAPYTPEERRQMDRTGGYWSHAGGLSPLLKAGPWIAAGTVSADFGAGNGLQCLLLQYLDPHVRTIQIEISSEMIAIGRTLQRWIGIPERRVEWVVGDVLDHTPEGLDFIYLYRPVRPDGEGRRFYERFAETLRGSDQPVVIFSIADCLRSFLPPSFEVFYSDGHLTCFRGPM